MNEKAVFGGGCFWCTEAVFKMLKGVSEVYPGYAGGTLPNPTYEQVCTGDTGHAEVVVVEYDPLVIEYNDLMTVFFASHNPTEKNRQGEESRGDSARPFENFYEQSEIKSPKGVQSRYGTDVGTQYRSVIFYTTEKQKEEALKYIAEINATSGGKPVVTEVEPLTEVYKAEDYHKDYFANHPSAPYCQIVINPKLDKVKEKFAELLREQS
jgi:peptide-methionine (S)-S-oxide reductase